MIQRRRGEDVEEEEARRVQEGPVIVFRRRQAQKGQGQGQVQEAEAVSQGRVRLRLEELVPVPVQLRVQPGRLRDLVSQGNKEVNYENFARVDTAKFKERAQVSAFAYKRSGVLAANVLNLVRTKMGQGNVTQTKQLRMVDMAQWVSSGQNGLKELRYQREACTPAGSSITSTTIESPRQWMSWR